MPARSRLVPVTTDVPAGLTARLDRRRSDVILANLVGNAPRHGGPPVTVQARIQSGGQGGGQLAVEVRDHGHGLPPAERARITMIRKDRLHLPGR